MFNLDDVLIRLLLAFATFAVIGPLPSVREELDLSLANSSLQTADKSLVFPDAATMKEYRPAAALSGSIILKSSSPKRRNKTPFFLYVCVSHSLALHGDSQLEILMCGRRHLLHAGMRDTCWKTHPCTVPRNMLHKNVVQDWKLRCIRRDQVSEDFDSRIFSVFVKCVLTSSLTVLILLEKETCILRIEFQ